MRGDLRPRTNTAHDNRLVSLLIPRLGPTNNLGCLGHLGAPLAATFIAQTLGTDEENWAVDDANASHVDGVRVRFVIAACIEPSGEPLASNDRDFKSRVPPKIRLITVLWSLEALNAI